jgi:transcriptional regulator GlxA family with amidase domain
VTCSSTFDSVQVAKIIVVEESDEFVANRALRDFLPSYSQSTTIPAGVAEAFPDEDRFRVMLNWVKQHIGQRLSVESLARGVGMHPRHFIPAFAASVGITPAKAIERIRVEAAVALMKASEKPIGVIAMQVGFSDAEHMSRAFLRVLGKRAPSIREILRHRLFADVSSSCASGKDA